MAGKFKELYKRWENDQNSGTGKTGAAGQVPEATSAKSGGSAFDKVYKRWATEKGIEVPKASVGTTPTKAEGTKKTTPTSYYARPDVDSKMESAYKRVTILEPMLKEKETALGKAEENFKKAETGVSFLQDQLGLLENAYKRTPTQDIADLYNKAYSQYEQSYKEYEAFLGEYNSAYADYRYITDRYNEAVTAYQGHAGELEAWKGTIRSADAIQTELDAVADAIRELESRERQTARMVQPGAYLQGTNGYATTPYGAALSQPKVSGNTVSQEMQALLDRQAMLKEEYDWSRHFSYADLMDNADFAEKSRYVSTENGKPVRNLMDGSYISSGFADPTYDYINRNPAAVFRQSINDQADGTAMMGTDRSYLQEMSDDEISIFNYLYATQGEDAAYDYVKYLNTSLTARQRRDTEKVFRDFAKKGKLAASTLSVAMAPLKGISYVGQAVDFLTDGKIDQNAGYNRFSYIPGAIREQRSEDIEQKWGKIGSFGYQTAMSMADFLTTSGIAGGNSALAMTIMGSGAAADTTIAAKDRGLEDWQAFTLGTVAGLAEAVTEKWSLDTLLDADLLKDSTRKYILKNMLAEGSEEVGSDIINMMADVIVSKDKNQWRQSVEAYKAQGMSESEALALAVKDQMISIGLDFLGGAISGGVMGGGNAMIQNIGNRTADQQTQKEAKLQQPEKAEIAEPQTVGEEMTRQIMNNWSDNPEPKVTVLPEANVGEEVVRSAQRMAKATGRDVVFYSEYGTKNGIQHGRHRDGTIYINSRSENPMAQIFSHELTHSVEMADSYKELSALVMKRIRDTGGNLQQLRKEKADTYAQNGHPLKTPEAVDAEIVAEYVEKNLLTNEQSIVSLTQENPSLGRRILNWIDSVLAKLGNKDAQARAFLTNARKLYTRALIQSHAVTNSRNGQTQTVVQDATVNESGNSQTFGDPGLQQVQPNNTGTQQGGDSIEDERAYADEMLRSGQWTEDEYDEYMEDYNQQKELEGADERFSISRTKKVPYQKQIDGYYKKPGGFQLQPYDDLCVMDNTSELKVYGLESKPVYMLKRNLNKSIREKGNNEHYSAHKIPEDAVRRIPEHIKEPALVVIGNGRVSIITDELVPGKYEDGVPMLIGMDPNSKVDGQNAYEIKSLYGVDRFDNWLRLRAKDSRVLAGKSNKAAALLQRAGVQFSGVKLDASDLTEIILAQDDGSVKEQFSISEPAASEAELGTEDSGKQEQPDIRSTLPAKARSYLPEAERRLLDKVGEKLGIPPTSRKSKLRGFIRNIMDEFLRNGEVTDDRASRLFDEAYVEGIVSDREAFASVVDLVAVEARNINRYVKEQQTEMTEQQAETTEQQKSEAVATPSMADLWQKLKDARKVKDRTVAKNLLTRSDEMKVAELLTGKLTLEQLDPENDNAEGITAVYEAKKEYEQLYKQLADLRRQGKAKLLQLADNYLQTANNWKDKGAGIRYSRETMRRNIYDIVPDKALAEKINREYFEPVHKAEAAATRFKTEMRDRVRALKLDTKVRTGNIVSEAHAVQLYGEAMDNIRVLEKLRGRMSMRDGKNLMEWQAAVDNLWLENPKLDKAKIENAVTEFRLIYDELFQKMNEVRIANGYEPVNYRQGYFPHFQPEGDSIIAHFGKALGISTQVDTLPTTINGLTHTFKPGIRWFGNAQERLGFNTAYDAVEGFDKYIEGVAGVICQTENIQKLRALATQIRYRTGDEGLRKQVDDIRNDESKSEDDKRRAIQEIYENGKYTLSNFVNELDEYTNLLANKKSKHDRTPESDIGRWFYTLMKNVESRVGANMINGNLSSALTNFIPLTQAWGRIGTKDMAKGMWDTLSTTISKDRSMVETSSFLTNRRGSDPLVKVWYEPVADVLALPMEVIDNFVSESIVRGAYYQNLKRGLSETEALYQADIMASSIMADRSKGSMPTLFERKNPIQKLFTQFQLEVNNQFSEIFKDIPREYKDKSKLLLALCLFKYFIGAFALNELEEKVKGRRSALDPIGIATRFAESVREDGLLDAAGNLIVDSVGSLPFSTLAAIPFTMAGVETDFGRIPIESAVPDLNALANAAFNDEWSKERRWATAGEEIAKPLTYLASPFGGGNQFAKSIKSFLAYQQGGSYGIEDVEHTDEDGNVTHVTGEKYLQYPVYKEDGTMNEFWDVVRAMMFGKSALDEAQEWVENDFNSLSAKHTAVYQDMLEAGVRDRDAHALIDDLKSAKKIGDKSETAVQRDILRESDISGDGKALAYYGMILQSTSENERALMDRLADAGADMGKVTSVLMNIHDTDDGAAGKREALRNSDLSGDEKASIYYSMILSENSEAERLFMDTLEADGADMGEVSNVLMDIHDADALTGADASCAKRDAIRSSALTEEEKLAVYSEKVSESRVEDFETFRSVGLGVDDFLEVHNAYARINDTDASAASKATQFSKWTNDQGYTREQKEAIKSSFAYYSMFPAEATTYDKLVSGGWDSDSAFTVAEAQTRLKKALPEFDENASGTYSQNEVRMAIDAMCAGANEKLYALMGIEDDGLELTNAQKAAIWQMQNKGWKPWKNPYDTDVGQQIYNLLNGE